MKRIIVFFFLLLCQSCVREEVIDNLTIPPMQDRLVIYGLLTPGDSVRINVRLSRAVNYENNSSGNDYADKALVKLTNLTTDQTITLKKTSIRGFYGVSQTQFPIRAGQAYAISVTYGDLSVESQCRIPSQAAVFDSLFATPHMYGGTSSINLRMYWQDISSPSESLMYFTGRTTYTAARPPYYPNGHSLFQIDVYNSKEQVKVDRLISYVNPETGSVSVERVDYYLFTIEPSVHRFFVEANQMAIVVNLSDEEPYETFKGIFPEYTNIKGGLGIFGGYLSHQQTVRFK